MRAADQSPVLDDGNAEAAARAEDDVVVEVTSAAEPLFRERDGTQVVFHDDGRFEAGAEQLGDGDVPPVGNE